MNWEFVSAETPPPVRMSNLGMFIILAEGRGACEHYTQAAYYLNRFPLEYEDCTCGDEHEDGCPTTGWFSDESNFEYENCYHPIQGRVIAYAAVPDGETAMRIFKGGPW